MIKLRCSNAKNWLTCSRMAEHAQINPPSQRIQHIGPFTGSHVHAAVTGQERPVADFIEFDEVTRSLPEMYRQVKAMHFRVKNILEDKDWLIVEKEVSLTAEVTVGDEKILLSGTRDLVVQNQETGQRILLDLKTGKRYPQQVFLQLCLYAYLAQRKLENIDCVGYLWVCRKFPHDIICDLRDATALASEAEDVLRRIAAVRQMGSTATPGQHCRRCPVENCAVRDGYMPNDTKRKLVRI